MSFKSLVAFTIIRQLFDVVLPTQKIEKWEKLIEWSYDPRSYERNFSNCGEKPENFRSSTGFEPVTSRVAPVSWGHGFKPRWIPDIFRLFYAISKIAFITASIIASLDFLYIRSSKYDSFHISFPSLRKVEYISFFLLFNSWSMFLTRVNCRSYVCWVTAPCRT